MHRVLKGLRCTCLRQFKRGLFHTLNIHKCPKEDYDAYEMEKMK